MIKLIVFIFSALSIFFASIFMNSEGVIFVEQSFPKNVSPGTEFTVTLTIHKGKQSGFARLQQFLPKGFTAEAVDTKKAQFINDEESAKFIWIALPAEEVFTVSYKVKVDANLSGLQVVNGLFYYIQDEKTQKISLDPIEITIGAQSAEVKPNVERKLISIDPDKGEFRVELTFHPTAEKIPAQFIDEIPSGFTAENIDSHGASFTFDNNKASFNWTTFPADSTFTIAYKVSSSTTKEAPQINGMLVYGNENDKTEAERKKETVADDSTPDSIIDALISSENDRQQMAEKAIEASNPPSTEEASTKTEISIPAPQSGIFYKVQICATRKSPARNSQYFTSKYKVENEVELTEHEGWKKYIIGSFTNYKEAKAFSEQTKSKVSDAFIVAYDNGERIPLNQAIKQKKVNQ